MQIFLKSSLVLIIFLFSSYIQADEKLNSTSNSNGLNLGNEYEEYGKERYGKGGGRSNSRSSGVKEKRSLATNVLLYIPNRILDLLDIIRIDVGVGPSAGAVVRITPYGQVGARFLLPISARAGLRGRKSPIFIEHTSEMGIGPAFLSSEARTPTILEVGAGLDFFVAGAYFGISFDSIADAVVGFVGYDLSDDDL